MADISWKAKMITQDLENGVKKEFRKAIKTLWESKEATIKNFGAQQFYKAIKEHQIYTDLEDGILGGELGVTNQMLSSFMEDILVIMEERMKCNYVGFAGANDLGGVLLTFENYQEEFNSSNFADYTSENGNYIPWLQWLTKYGTRDIVFGYKFLLEQGKGRTNLGIMVQSQNDNYAVPAYAAGVTNNNWFTEAANVARPIIVNFILEQLRSL